MSQFKKLISLFLSIVMILGFCSFSVYAEDNSITVYITVSRYGSVLEDKSGNEIISAPIQLSGETSYTLDDVFFAAHELLYDGGAEAGYGTETVDPWGLSVTKFWGDTSGNFGYQVNSGEVAVMGPSHQVEDEDVIDAYILTSAYEGYAKFDKRTAETVTEKPFELTLYSSYYDSQDNMLFEPCSDAMVKINGEETELITDADGKVTLTFEEEGKYVVSAAKTRVIGDDTLTAFTYPVCVVTAEVNPAIAVMHNIARKYSTEDIVNDGNMQWLVADMAVYEYLYPDGETALTENIKQMCLDKLVREAASAGAPGTLAKDIIALRALGYDATKLHTFLYQEFDAVSALTALIDSQDGAVSNIYTLPYVIIALNQAPGYATGEQMAYLLDAAVSSKEAWLDTTWGTDAITPMVLALAPFYDTDDNIKNAIDEAMAVVRDFQQEDGLIGNAASCGLAMAAFSAMGTDVYDVVSGENSLVEGILTKAADDLDAFLPVTNSFSTEQGFRGLIAWRLLKEDTDRIIYDFSSNPMEEAYATGVENCPVTITPVPANSSVSIEGQSAVFDNTFDLGEGTYTYTVSKSGYHTKRGEFTVTADEALSHTEKEIEVALEERNHGGGGSVKDTYTVTFNTNGGTDVTKQKIDENENAQSPEKPEKDGFVFCGWFTDEDFTEEYDFSQKVTKNLTLYAKWEEKPAENMSFADVAEEAWYYEAVNYVSNKGIMQGTDKGFEPDSNMTRAMLVTVLYRLENDTTTAKETIFEDVAKDKWYYDSIMWAADKGIVNGISETSFAPDNNITRQEMAVILYRYAMTKGYVNSSAEGSLEAFSDRELISSWAQDALLWANGIALINGTSDTTISPKETATRAQVATILMRFCENADK